MFVEVNGTKLYFDVKGAGLVPDGPRMRTKPTLFLLHGGPGFDHSIYKPAFSALADIVQIAAVDAVSAAIRRPGPWPNGAMT